MKTIIFSAILLLMVSDAGANTSTGAIDVQYRLSSYGHHLILNTSSWKNLELTVSIVDEQEHVLLTKAYKASSAFNACKFDLSALKRGQYKIFIADSEKSYKQKFTILRQEIFISPQVETYVKPVFKLNEDQLMVSFLSFGLPSSIRILDQTNESIYEAEVNEPSFNKILNLSKLYPGTYSIVVTVGPDQHWHVIDLK